MDNFGVISLLPVVVVIVLVYFTKRTATSLAAGSLVASIIMWKFQFLPHLLEMIYQLISSWLYIWIILVVAFFGALVTLFEESGGVLAPISTWGVFMTGQLVSSGLCGEKQSLSTFLHVIPFTFYPILALLFSFLVAAEIIPVFGPMKEAEVKKESEASKKEGKARHLIIPVIVPIAMALDANLMLTAGAIISATTAGAQFCFYGSEVTIACSAMGIENMRYVKTCIPMLIVPTALTVICYIATAVIL